MDYKLLKQLCQVQAPSGSESQMTTFLLDYIKANKKRWKVKPKILAGNKYQDCIMLVFGKPSIAAFAHMDSIGFTVAYDNKLIPIGGPEAETGYELIGHDSHGLIETKLVFDEKEQYLVCDAKRRLDRGTTLTFKCDFIETDSSVQSCYLDNRLGVFAMLQVCETLENGIVVFSCYEEHGGGTVPFLVRYLWEQYKIRKTLIADITWVTAGVQPGAGVAISLRDSRIPRKKYLDKIVSIAENAGIKYQLEVEGAGGSDGREIQNAPYPIDWCFIGAAEENVHSPNEKVHKDDIEEMVRLYELLFKEL
ncbi:MAG TPA: M20/M25/M40 family metallo-hydrolase [Cytophagales bacterium]|nr:M20/M25/M40 family metallo-hydrolase [Cytophagales bacterium]